ncbi:unnamed protein product [Heterobilharzia americana]|nr:unnamed protein product [Heterobilharzia americana]
MASRRYSSSGELLQSTQAPRFENVQLKHLPIDNGPNVIRPVRNACFARVTPAKVDNPRLVLFSRDVLSLLDIQNDIDYDDEHSGQVNVLVEYLSGNKLWPGSDPTAHCYCGYQFGSFAGQLGDGAAISLGEVVNSRGERWELQLKGSGLTPFSRQGDGRKVLRSSLREFLCSEAMHYLGDNIFEKASITSRVAKTFIRFGSFEISKPQDVITGRYGPSVGNKEIVSQLTNFVIQQFYPHIWEKNVHSDDMISCYLEFFEEVVRRTANLVALWQTVGFCHGVLNTDNMSIIGLTIDYGPFGFIDQFTWDHISNTSDPDGRYSYAQQPSICAWNCARLAECLIQALIDQQKTTFDESKKERKEELQTRFTSVLNSVYMPCFNKVYLERMRKKLGLLHSKEEIDSEIVHDLLDTMEKTGADFTNTFLALEDTLSQAFNKYGENLLKTIEDDPDYFLQPDLLVQECCNLSQLQETFEPFNIELHHQLLSRFAGIRENFVDKLEEIKVLKFKAREELYKELEHMTEEENQQRNVHLWNKWLKAYTQRLKIDFQLNNNNTAFSTRLDLMKSVNPRIVLRNHFAEEAIKSAETGDYTVARKLFNALRTPFEEMNLSPNDEPNQSTPTCSRNRNRPPDWSRKLRVSCSS